MRTISREELKQKLDRKDDFRLVMAQRFFRVFRRRSALCAGTICSCGHLYVASRQSMEEKDLKKGRVRWTIKSG